MPQEYQMHNARRGAENGGQTGEAEAIGDEANAFPAKMPLHRGNLLIDSLPAEDRRALMEAARPFDFALGHIFCEHGDLAATVDFIERGVVSAVFAMQDGRSVEAYMIGREGATNPMAVEVAGLSSVRLVAQIAGSARRIEVAKLRTLVAERPAIRDALIAYAGRLLGELEQSTACNALHKAEQRFAKWLLRCHDRTDGDVLRLTQEFLANMLGAQRTTVNEAAQQLQKAGAIRYMRGSIEVKDRAALERVSCDCYAAHYETLRRARLATGAEPE